MRGCRRRSWNRFVSDRWFLHLLNRATKRPQRPSEFLGLRAFGYDAGTLIDFDLAIERFDIWYEERANASVDVPAEKRTGPPMTKVPKYPTVADVLDLDGEGEAATRALTPEEQATVAALAHGTIDPLDLLTRRTRPDREDYE